MYPLRSVAERLPGGVQGRQAAEQTAGGRGEQRGFARGLIGSRQQQLVFLNIHWGRKYEFAAPALPDGHWTATARFGEGDRLRGDSAGQLLEQVRYHYRSSG